MSVVNQDSADKSIGRVFGHFGGAVMEQLVFVINRLDRWLPLSRLQDKARGNAAKYALDLLSDYYLDDVGIRRRIDLRTEDLVKRLRAGG